MKNDKNRINIETTSSALVNPGKSSRLQAMRDKAMSAQSATVIAGQQPDKAVLHGKAAALSPEMLLARQIIDRQLDEILAMLPAGRQKRLFKIRFGVELEQIRDLPIKHIVGILKIKHPQLNNLSADMKRIADLNYNGDLPAPTAD